jgi:hypothetical protein
MQIFVLGVRMIRLDDPTGIDVIIFDDTSNTIRARVHYMQRPTRLDVAQVRVLIRYVLV